MLKAKYGERIPEVERIAQWRVGVECLGESLSREAT